MQIVPFDPAAPWWPKLLRVADFNGKTEPTRGDLENKVMPRMADLEGMVVNDAVLT